MKLLIATGLFYPSKLGGPANTLYWLSKALVKEGVDVSVVAGYSHIDAGKVEKDKWNLIDGIRAMYCTVKGKLPLRVVLNACKELKKSDALMLSSVCFLPNSLIAIYARLLHKKTIWSLRGELLGSALKNNLPKIAHFKFLKLLLGKSVVFHATSEEEKKSIQRMFGENARVVILPNYFEMPEQQVRQITEPSYLLYVGRIAPIKALDNLLEGLAKSDKFIQSDYVLKIVGGVEDKFKDFYDKLLNLQDCLGLKDRVQFIGPKFGKDKFQYYANARFSVLPSYSENFGNVIIEALSQGTPVIASKGTPWQILNDKCAGFWIDNSAEAIAKCIDQALSIEEEQYREMRDNALLLGNEFDVSKNVQKWVEALNDI